MSFKQNILKGKYFPTKNRESTLASMISLYAILAIPIIGLDALESYITGHELMFIIEISAMSLMALAYLLFPRVISLNTMIYLSIFPLIFLLLSSFYVNDANDVLTLFWMAGLPILIFYFMGLKMGVKVSYALSFILFLMTLASHFDYVQSVYYDTSLLFQLYIGYMALSYSLYRIEYEKESNASDLAKALEGKEVLFKEVHHRTKNNMQVMMGLLETQSFKIQEPKYKKMFQSHADRIKAMSTVHEYLYSSENYEVVDMYTYINGLADGLQSYTSHQIVRKIEHVFLDMKTSMSVGLIFNESVTNIIEHAYEKDVMGRIEVTLINIEEGKCFLRIKDYGKGYVEQNGQDSIGLQLIEDLAQSLPSGKLEVSTVNGTEINVYFDIKDKDYNATT